MTCEVFCKQIDGNICLVYFFFLQRFNAYQDLDNMASIVVAEVKDNIRTRALKTRSYVSKMENIT